MKKEVLMIIIPALFVGFNSLKDRTMNLKFETNEPTPEQMVAIAHSVQHFGYLAFKEELFNEREKKAIEDLKTDFDDQRKTPSQRLRGVLFRGFEQNNEGYKDFNSYYAAKMEQVIKHFKSKLH